MAILMYVQCSIIIICVKFTHAQKCPIFYQPSLKNNMIESWRGFDFSTVIN